MILVLFILLFVSVILEGTIASVPLTLICLLCFLIAKPSRAVFYGAFFAGLLIDIFTLQPLGLTAGFFLVFLYLVLLYEKKYEINSYPFVVASSFLGSFLFGFIFGNSNVLMSSIISSILAIILYTVLKLINKL